MNKPYRTVEHEAHEEWEEKRSRFIGHVYPVKTEEEALSLIKSVKKQYADATHNCTAYILGDGTVARYSDDGEPQGTAGMPMLEAIRKSGVTDCLAVVTRYFGGILLGAGGLVRAYSHSVSLAMESARIITYSRYYQYTLTCDYSYYGKVSSLLAELGVKEEKTDFADAVRVFFSVREETDEPLRKKMTELFCGKENLILTGEKFDYEKE